METNRPKIIIADVERCLPVHHLVHRPHSYLHYCDFRLQWEHAESGSSGLARSYDESRAGPTVAIALGFARFGTAKPDYFGGRCRQDQSANR